MAAPSVPGKTAFRDALASSLAISASDAEVLCDSLERGGGLRFTSDVERGPQWTIAPLVARGL